MRSGATRGRRAGRRRAKPVLSLPHKFLKFCDLLAQGCRFLLELRQFRTQLAVAVEESRPGQDIGRLEADILCRSSNQFGGFPQLLGFFGPAARKGTGRLRAFLTGLWGAV